MKLRKGDSGTSEAEAALESSKKDLNKIKARQSKVETVVHDIILIHQRNHFAEQISMLMQRPKGV